MPWLNLASKSASVLRFISFFICGACETGKADSLIPVLRTEDFACNNEFSSALQLTDALDTCEKALHRVNTRQMDRMMAKQNGVR